MAVSYMERTVQDAVEEKFYGVQIDPFAIEDEDKAVPEKVDIFTSAMTKLGCTFIRLFNKYRRIAEYKESFITLGDDRDDPE